MTDNLRRSFLFTPADDTDMMRKAADSDADAVIFDLEDAVNPAAVPDARENVRSVVRDGATDFGRTEVCVRVNGIATDDWLEDVRASADAGVDAIMLPMVETPAELRTVAEVLRQITTAAERPEIIVNVETPTGLFASNAIAETGGSLDAVTALSFGVGDYTNAIGATGASDSVREFLSHVTVAAAATGGLAPIYTIYQDYHDPDGLREVAEFARELGYVGQPAIHPSQIDVINDVFTPSEEEVERARELVSAFEESERDSISEQGVFLDTAIVEQYRTVIDRYEAVSDDE